MSVLHTESFIAYQAVNSSDDSFTTGNTTARNAVAANLRRGGHAVTIKDQSSASLATGWAIRPDPVNPDRNALFFSAGGFQSNTMCAAIRKTLPIVMDAAIVGGFSLYIPNEYTKPTVSTTNPVLRVMATNTKDTSWDTSSSGNTHGPREVFRISQDLQVRWGVDAAQSQKTVGTGRTYFIEYRISTNDVRVWIDDTLVMQKTGLGLTVECIALGFEQWTPASGGNQNTGAAGRWSIGNWYNLVEDANAPNVRLGPSTRVIGVRPNTDVVANFIRPGGYTSNAQVAALDLVDSPPASLQSSTVGDQDIYTSTTDTTTASGTMIHSVGVKVLASNLESNPHAIRPLLRAASNASEATAQKAREMRIINASISTKQLNGLARRPTDGKLFAVGNSIALLTNANNGQGAWTTVSDDGGTVHYTCIAFRSDGWGVIGRSDGKLQTIAPGTDTPGTAIAPGSNTFQCNVCMTMPDGRVVVACNSGAVMRGPTTAGGTPDVVGNWTRSTGLGANLIGMAYAPPASGLGTGSGRLVVASDGNPAISYRSDDEGSTWSASSSIGVSAPKIVWDTQAFVAYQNIGPWNTSYNRRSTDGITWSQVTSGTQAPSITTGAPYGCIADPDNLSLSIFVGNNGLVQCSTNGVEYRVLTPLTTNALRGIAKAANGDWIMVGDSGIVVAYTAGLVDGSMPALAGYTPYSNYSSVNPATATSWTAAEASASQFGMRLTS